MKMKSRGENVKPEQAQARRPRDDGQLSHLNISRDNRGTQQMYGARPCVLSTYMGLSKLTKNTLCSIAASV